MNKLSILIGIGFMLVSALSYSGTPEAEADITRLTPALVGLAVALVGIRGLSGQESSMAVLFANIISCFLLIVYSSMHIVPDAPMGDMICNISLIVYSMLFVFVTRRAMVEGSLDAPIL